MSLCHAAKQDNVYSSVYYSINIHISLGAEYKYFWSVRKIKLYGTQQASLRHERTKLK